MKAWFDIVAREWRGLKAFKALPRGLRKIVFYSQGRGYWTYFQPVFLALRDEFGLTVVYVTSAGDDPLLVDTPPGMHAIYVGSGSFRTLFFSTLEADVLLMTMPDLQYFHIKRSPHPVKYVYLHHSMVSTHMIYREAAFDRFDAILCSGPHHVEETRKREQLLGLRAKRLVEHGYGRLDTLMAESESRRMGSVSSDPQVLVAPTWGKTGLLEMLGSDVVRPLIEAGYRVVVRPHPRTRRDCPDAIEIIAAEYRDHPRFRLDEDSEARTSLLESDLMISDWSGTALEFAFGLERPVIFIDTPRKILNPNYAQLGIEPLEVRIRPELGAVVSVANLSVLVDVVKSTLTNPGQSVAKMRALREHWIYNVGYSGNAAAKYLSSLV